MQASLIQHYPFNSPSSLGVEVKPLAFLWEKAEKSGQVHRAEFYQFLWIRGGELRLMLDFRELCLRAEEALLIAPGQVVRYHLEEQSEGFSVLFVPEFLGEAHSDRPLLQQILRASLSGEQGVSLRGLPIAGLLAQLDCELAREASFEQLIIARSCLRILLAELARSLPNAIGRGGELAGRFFDLVEEEHRRLHQIQDYLQRLGVMEKPLTQAVRQAVGRTPKVYLDQRRLLEAKRYLVYSELSIKEIAYQLGFDEPTNFNKFFRKHAGLTPLDFRAAQVVRG